MSQFEYPRPQLVRDEWMSLNGEWEFAYDNELRYRGPGDDRIPWELRITVPFCPESPASGLGDQDFHPCVWYRRSFELDVHGEHILLHFGAVDYAARVWLNGQLVAQHEGGHTPFTAEITEFLVAGGPQVLVVRAEDDPADLHKPRGKQDWLREPHSIWYPRTTGIWQTVWVEAVCATWIKTLRWTPIFDGFEIGCEVLAAGQQKSGLSVEVRLSLEGRLLADDVYMLVGQEANRKIALSDPGIDDSRNELLWSPERPTLIDAEVILRDGDRVLDTVRSYTALRSVSINRDRFMLNGRAYPLRLVLDQGYWTESLMTAPSDEALRRDVELAKAMGFNGVRKHQKIEDPRYLYWADKLGLLVWEEMPSAYAFSPRAVSRLVREWTEAIERDYSHPSVIVWVPFNESWGVPNLTAMQAHRNAVEALYHMTRVLDATRPVIGNDGWEASATDILGIHDYDGDPQRLAARYVQHDAQTLFDRRRPGGRILTLDGFPHRGQPIVLTEFGGIAYDPKASAQHTWGYSRSSTADGYHQLYRALLKAVNDTAMFAGFCYTQFADTFQETNGLLNADRSPKIPLEQISAATRNAGH
ncbi:glycoside hydrolase family 2 protein [Oxalobacteraceae bacterium A2-2]